MASRTLLEPGRETRRRDEAAAPPATVPPPPRRRGILAGPIVAAFTLVVGFIATDAADVPLRDPDHVAALYFVLVGFGVALLVGLDVAIRAGRRTRTRRPSRAAMRQVRRERWTPARSVAVGTALLSFYLTYMAYRNLKAIVPLLRPGDLFDRQLADLDRGMFAGHDPADLLHTALGVGVSTHFLSIAYAAFIVFLPLSLGVALVFSRDIRAGLFYATALSVNWVLGAASYFLLPSLGPIYYEPKAFAHLPHSEVTRLQDMLLDQRVEFLAHPTTALPQAIAAFASLHISMSLTAALAAHLLGLGRRLKIVLWVWLALTILATVYFGWHYFLDDIAGVAIAAGALGLARGLTGIDLRALRVTPRAPQPSAD
jgi:membrane-associated phospholipid phosphatase